MWLMSTNSPMKVSRRRTAGFVWLLVVLGPMILFGPMLLGGEALFWGTPLLQFVPWRTYALRVMAEGYLPLWNPLLGMGAPLIANYQSAIFYPPNVLLALTGPAWGQGLLVMFHLQWAAIGTLLFLRRLRVRTTGQAVGALAFSLSGYMVARAGFLSINAAAAWLPWVLLACEHLIEIGNDRVRWRRRIPSMLAFAFCLAMQWLSGHAQTAWYSLLFVLMWSAWRSYAGGKLRGVFHNTLSIAVSGVMGFCLAAIQLIPTLEYLIHSQRASQVEAELALTYSFWPWRLLGLLMPNLFGNPAHGDYWGYANFWEDAIYIGIMPLVFVFLGIVGAKKEPSRKDVLCFMGLATGISLLLALGKNTPVFPFLYDHVPTFDLFQAPTRWSLLMVFPLSVMAGVGADIWQGRRLVSLFWLRLGTAGAAAIPIFAWLATLILPSLKAGFFWSIASLGILLLIAGGIALLRPIPLSGAWQTLLILFVMADLVIAGWGLNPSVPLDIYRRDSSLRLQIDTEHRLYMPEDVEYAYKFEHTHSFKTFDPGIDWSIIRDAGLPNTTMLDGFCSANNFDPILSGRFAQWTAALEDLPFGQQEKIFALMDVGSVAELDTDKEARVRYLPVHAPQRVRLIADTRWVATAEEALDAVMQPSFDPDAEIVLEGPAPEPEMTTGGGGSVRIIHQDDPNAVIIQTESDQGSWLLLSDAAYPGWKAFIDGQESTIFEADYLFRGVYLPAGDHLVEFRYQPASFRWGLGLTLGAIVSCILLWMIRARDGVSTGRS